MPITSTQIQFAERTQFAAAQDQSAQVRLVAGPGTGKSRTIEERVRWLLSQNELPNQIFAVSFTRASALDLRSRIQSYCIKNNQPTVIQVQVSTLHSLALRTLRSAGLLTAYPVDPLVLDEWETESIFDAEFRIVSGINSKPRSKEIRRENEAFWSTGQWGPPNYIPPNPPISNVERNKFQIFHGPRTQTYSCVLPGEIVRQCVEQINAGTLNPVTLLNLNHLIVDEYQDLNPMDLDFIDAIAKNGAILFIAGDDDQSIYAFRYASPSGIQNFTINYPNCGDHNLTDCFRCTPAVLKAGQLLIDANPLPNKITKSNVSLYNASNPPVQGILHCWRFTSGVSEARAIVESCRDLIQAGINPKEILILLSNKRLWPTLNTEFINANVSVDPPRAKSSLDTDTGRFILSLLRIISNNDDYIAHRVLLGLLPGVGIGTCNAICEDIILNNLNYRKVFYHPLPAGLFTGRALTALNKARKVCNQIANWQSADTIAQRINDISLIINNLYGNQETQNWQDYALTFPDGTTLEELRDLLWADTIEQQEALLQTIYERLELTIPSNGLLPSRVRVMTMHGAKGLSARVVFIPALEAEILPGPWRRPYPGLVLEAARLLYVSITRARAACIISYAKKRIVYGSSTSQTHSRFCTQLGNTFTDRNDGLISTEVQQIVNTCANL